MTPEHRVCDSLIITKSKKTMKLIKRSASTDHVTELRRGIKSTLMKSNEQGQAPSPGPLLHQ